MLDTEWPIGLDLLDARSEHAQDLAVQFMIDLYFEKVWGKMSDSSRGEYLGYFTSKLSRFIEDRMLRNILGQRGGRRARAPAQPEPIRTTSERG